MDIEEIPSNEDPNKLFPFSPFSTGKSSRKRRLTFHDYIKAIEDAQRDGNVVGMVAKLDNCELQGAQVDELREVLRKFNERKRYNLAYASKYNSINYRIATAFDKIYIHPLGDVEILLKSNFMGLFFKNFLDKFGIRIQKYARKEFKSFGDALTNDSFSPEDKQSILQVEHNLFNIYFEMLYKARERQLTEKNPGTNTKELAKELFQLGPYTSKRAYEMGLVDGFLYYNLSDKEYLNELSNSDFKVKSLFEYALLRKARRVTDQNLLSSDAVKIGLVFVQTSFTAESETKYCKLFDRIYKNDEIDTIVIRIDSPGGSPVACDSIYESIQRLKKKGKRVIGLLLSIFGN